MSNSHTKGDGENREKVIQRTVSIVINGKNQNVQNGQDLMNTLSKIILGD